MPSICPTLPVCLTQRFASSAVLQRKLTSELFAKLVLLGLLPLHLAKLLNKLSLRHTYIEREGMLGDMVQELSNAHDCVVEAPA